MSAPHGLNGLGPLAEATRLALQNVRRDWQNEFRDVRRDIEVSDAQLRARLAEGLLELERTCSLMRERLELVQDGAPGKPGEPGAPGKDADPLVIGRMIDEAIAKLPPAKDGEPGKSVDPAEVERLVAEAVARLPKPKDGEPGKDAEPVNRIELAILIDAAVAQAVEAMPKPKDGEPGKEGPPGKFVAPKPFKVGAITYEGALVYHEGSTFCALRDTAATPPHEDFQPVAYRGRDAYAGRALGLFDATRTDYRAMDVVTLNGSEWRATKDSPGPCPGDGWVLGAKKGKPGDKGDPGGKGDPGERGPPGDGFVHVERIESSLVFTRVDGSAVSIDLGTLVA